MKSKSDKANRVAKPVATRRKKTLALAAALLFGCTIFAGCSKEEAKEKAPLVKTMQAQDAEGERTSSYSGVVRGRYETNLAFQVGGQIVSRNVNVGARVSPGDCLMTINPKDVVQEANAGSAQVSAARAQLSLAQTNLARYTELYNQDAVPAAVRDQYQTNYDAAFAAYQQALAQAAEANNAVGYTNLTAGAAGVISSITAEEGQVVAAGQTVMTLVQTNELEVEIQIPESHIAELSQDEAVKVDFWALGSAGSSEGTVREISPTADSASRTYKVRIKLPKPPKGLSLGMSADVKVPEPAASGIVLPLSAIYQTGDAPEVWVVDEDRKVTLKEVSVEAFDDNNVRVRGLSAGDTVVTAGVHKLREGQKVRMEEEE